jgi:hypothetical protein
MTTANIFEAWNDALGTALPVSPTPPSPKLFSTETTPEYRLVLACVDTVVDATGAPDVSASGARSEIRLGVFECKLGRRSCPP